MSKRKPRSKSLQPTKRPRIQDDIELNNVHKNRDKLKSYNQIIKQYTSDECDKLLKLFEIIHKIQNNRSYVDKLTYLTDKYGKDMLKFSKNTDKFITVKDYYNIFKNNNEEIKNVFGLYYKENDVFFFKC